MAQIAPLNQLEPILSKLGPKLLPLTKQVMGAWQRDSELIAVILIRKQQGIQATESLQMCSKRHTIVCNGTILEDFRQTRAQLCLQSVQAT